ncbi:MAG: hypothetical protein MUP15_00730 [Dehalococcoidia bacterium]|nr:hypothetical protein [Dehalococcoidia bacterium]
MPHIDDVLSDHKLTDQQQAVLTYLQAHPNEVFSSEDVEELRAKVRASFARRFAGDPVPDGLHRTAEGAGALLLWIERGDQPAADEDDRDCVRARTEGSLTGRFAIDTGTRNPRGSCPLTEPPRN